MKRNIPKITDGELNVLEVLWKRNEPMAASEIVSALKGSINWNRNTTYTFINRLVDKEVIKRSEPGFVCTPLFEREEILVSETRTFLDRMFNGSLKMLVANFIDKESLSEKEMEDLKRIIEKGVNKE